jgi:hypothetical protein
MRRALACVLFAALARATTASAQQPFVVDDAEVTPPRVWHLEVSNQVDWLRRSARPARWQDTLEWEVAYGMRRRLEIALLVPVIGLASDGPSGRFVAIGPGDSSLALKYRITSTSDDRHALAASMSLELPTGSRARQLGTGLVDYGVNVISQHRLLPPLALRFNGGILLAGNTLTGAVGIKERGTILTGGLSLTGRLAPRVQIGAELTSAWSQRAAVGGSAVGWQAGGNLDLRDGLTLDFGVLGGWFDASPRAGLQLGVSVDLGR